MSIFDKAKQFATDNTGKVAAGVDKATDFIDQKTGRTHTSTLEHVDDAARDYADAGVADEAADRAASDPTTSDLGGSVHAHGDAGARTDRTS